MPVADAEQPIMFQTIVSILGADNNNNNNNNNNNIIQNVQAKDIIPHQLPRFQPKGDDK